MKWLEKYRILTIYQNFVSTSRHATYGIKKEKNNLFLFNFWMDRNH